MQAQRKCNICFFLMNMFIQKACIKLIKSDSKDTYNVTNITVKLLNHIQNKSVCLHNICMCVYYVYTIYKYTQMHVYF